MLQHGVTGVLPALYNNLNKEAYLKAVDDILKAKEDGKFENFVGFYIGGAYRMRSQRLFRDRRKIQ